MLPERCPDKSGIGVRISRNSHKGETIDIQYLLKALEDLNKTTEPFFNIYCKNTVPLAILALSEGGIMQALGRIQHEKRGFINFCAKTPEDFGNQKRIAKEVIEESLPFYIDGTSLLFLSGTDLFEKIKGFLSQTKVPQSVMNLLADVCGKFEYSAKQAGYLGYAQSKIIFSSLEKDISVSIQSKLINSIKFFELNPLNISAVSSANKEDCFSEQKIPAELNDACILAQREIYL